MYTYIQYIYIYIYTYIFVCSYHTSDLENQGAVIAKVAVLDVVQRNLAQPAQHQLQKSGPIPGKNIISCCTRAYSYITGQIASLNGHSLPLEFVIVPRGSFCTYPTEKWNRKSCIHGCSAKTFLSQFLWTLLGKNCQESSSQHVYILCIRFA